MSLITRCPACGTMFKVVTDQLKVSQGWVRCGQCTEVFNASVHLQPHPAVAGAAAAQHRHQAVTADGARLATPDFADSPPTSSPTPFVQPPAGVNIARWEGGDHPDPGADEQEQPFSLPPPASLHDEFEADARFENASALQSARSGSLNVSPAALAPQQIAPDVAPDITPDTTPGIAPEVVGSTGDSPPAVVRAEMFSLAAADASKTGETAETAETPDYSDELPPDDVSFVRDAKRKAFWRKPLVRLTLSFFVVLLVALLLVQAVVQNKDRLLAHEPRLKPLLVGMCQQLQCELAPLRQIDAMVIDSSSFNKTGSDSFRLSFMLKNTASGAVALPALEVTLTNTQDQALIRRVLMPAQFGAADGGVLGAGQDFAGLVLLQVPGGAGSSADSGSAGSSPNGASLRVAGYRLLAFYP